MSDLSSFPQDIRKAAEAVVDRGYNEGLIDAVCRALANERERAAKIAEAMDTDGRSNWGAVVAARIREGEQP